MLAKGCLGEVWLLLFHPKLLGCQGADQARSAASCVARCQADFNSLAEQNEQLSQQLKQAILINLTETYFIVFISTYIFELNINT